MAQCKLRAQLDDGIKIYPQIFNSDLEAYRFICEKWLNVEDFDNTFLNEIGRAHTIDALLSELGFETVREPQDGIDPNIPVEMVS